MLTELQKASFLIHEVFYWYYPRLPMGWNSNYTTYTISNSKLKWSLWICCLFCTTFVGLANFYVIGTHFLLTPRKTLRFTHIVIFSSGGCGVLTTCILASMVMIRRRLEANMAFNGVFQLRFQMTKDIRPEAIGKDGNYIGNADRHDLIGYGMCLLSFCLSSTPFLIVLIVVFEGFDVVTFIAHDILPPAEHWDIKILLSLHLIRFLVVGVSILECVRCLNVFVLIACLELVNFQDIFIFLTKFMTDTPQFILNYLRLVSCYKCLETIVSDMCLVIVSVAFWGTVLGICVIVNLYEKLEFFFYIGATGAVFLTILGTGFVIRLIKGCLVMITEMLETRVKMAKVRYIRTKTIRSKAVLKRTLALTPMVLWYGTFMPVTVEFVIAYVDNLVERVIDFLLMSR
ncbi:unnamed protein product [Orchesella dallaii]|uniref:Odorant receptor n=1 Tax=Orchesella dallaii TaxID=48710 RepID=A0ABP1RS47_9HEXA